MKNKVDKNNLFENIPQDGRHLAPQKGAEDGLFWGSTLDDETGKARGTGSFRKVDPSELKEGNQDYVEGVATGAALALGLYYFGKFGKWVYRKLKGHKEMKDEVQNEGAESLENTEIVGERVDTAYTDYRERMTSEEAKKKLIAAYIHAIMAMRKLQRVADAEVVQDDETVIEGKQLIETLQKEQLIESINEILIDQPALLEDTYRGLWAEIVGCRDEGEAVLVPLTTERVKEYLSSNNAEAENG